MHKILKLIYCYCVHYTSPDTACKPGFWKSGTEILFKILNSFRKKNLPPLCFCLSPKDQTCFCFKVLSWDVLMRILLKDVLTVLCVLLFDSIILRIIHIKVVKQTVYTPFLKNQPLQCLVQLVSAESFKYGTTNVYEIRICVRFYSFPACFPLHCTHATSVPDIK